MSVNKTRGWLYWLAKALGDYQAAKKALDTGSLDPVAKRIGRRIAGKITGRLLGKLFR